MESKRRSWGSESQSRSSARSSSRTRPKRCRAVWRTFVDHQLTSDAQQESDDAEDDVAEQTAERLRYVRRPLDDTPADTAALADRARELERRLAAFLERHGKALLRLQRCLVSGQLQGSGGRVLGLLVSLALGRHPRPSCLDGRRSRIAGAGAPQQLGACGG